MTVRARCARCPTHQENTMALLHKLTKELHKEFWESGALALNRDQTVSLLELLAEVAGQVDHLTHMPIKEPSTETKA
jgi:hypothetical protein